MKNGRPTVCAAGGACRTLGGNAAAKVKDADVEVSADGSLASIGPAGEQAVWDVASDRVLDRFEAPDNIEATYRSYVSYEFEDELVIGEWVPCAGPCYTYQVFRRDGAPIGATYEDGEVGGVAAKGRYAILRDKLELWDVRTATMQHELEIVPEDFEHDAGRAPADGATFSDALVRLPGDRLAVVVRGKGVIAVAIVDVVRGEVVRMSNVPLCDLPAQ
jgi:hypothetical protein